MVKRAKSFVLAAPFLSSLVVCGLESATSIGVGASVSVCLSTAVGHGGYGAMVQVSTYLCIYM